MLPDEITVNFKFRPKLLLVSPIAILLAFGLFQMPWGDASAPAWVQAIGTILAVLAAWYFPYRHGLEVEQRAERRLVKEQRKKQKSYIERVEEICRLARTCMSTGEKFLGEYPARLDGELISDALDDAYRCLNSIDVFEIENFRIAQDVLLIRSSLATGRGQLKGIMSSKSLERDIYFATFCKCASNVEVGWQRISNISNPAPSSGNANAA